MALLNRKTIGLMVSAIVLGGGVLLFESSQGDRTTDTGPNTVLGDDAKTPSEPIFTFEEDAITQFSVTRTAVAEEVADEENAEEIVDEENAEETADEENAAEEKTETLSFEKGDNDVWRMTQPETADAEQGAIAFLLSQMTGTAAQTLSVSPDQLEEFGLTDPEATVTLEAEGNTYEFLLGGADFSGGKRYVQAIDATAETAENTADGDASDDVESSEPITIHLIAGSITSAMNRPTAEWLPSASPEDEAPEEDSESEDADTTESSSELENSEEN